MDKMAPPPYNPQDNPYPAYPNQGMPMPMPQQQPGMNVHIQPPVHMIHQQQPQTILVTNPTVIVTGNCPGCRRGVLRTDFTCCGWCLAIFLFPIGILFCLLLAEKKCSHCGGTF